MSFSTGSCPDRTPRVSTTKRNRAPRNTGAGRDPGRRPVERGGRTVQGYADQVGLHHIKSHDVRRFVGTQLAKRDSRKAQKALGHKRIDTTAQYYVLDELEEGLTDDLY